MAQVGCRDSVDRHGAVRSPLGRHALGALDDRLVGDPSTRRGEAGGADAGAVEIRRVAGVRGVVGTVAYAASQLLLIAVLYGAYSFSRHLAAGREPAALANAKSVWRLERILRLPSEASTQHLALHSHVLIRSADWFYILVHFPSVIALLLWVFIRHRRHWTRVRNVLILTTGIALVIHLLYPLAPPRFLPSVLHIPLVDTGARYGPSPYGEGSGGIANEYAAMPSLHVGWSLIEAWAIVTILRHRVRWLAVLHPVLTITVVVITANHYWLDGMIGSSLVVVSIVLLDQATRWWSARGADRPAVTPLAARGGSGAGSAPRPGGIPAARDGAPSRPGARRPPGVPTPASPADEPSRR